MKEWKKSSRSRRKKRSRRESLATLQRESKYPLCPRCEKRRIYTKKDYVCLPCRTGVDPL